MRTKVRCGLEKVLESVGIGRGSSHLADRELVRVLAEADGRDPTLQTAHLRGCARCADRVRILQAGLSHMAETAAAAFDDAVPAWRLLRQRRRIMHRIRRASGRRESARILRFPTAARRVTLATHPSRGRLWQGAAAGFLLAGAIGHVVLDPHQPAADPEPSVAAAPSQETTRLPVGPPRTVPDEQFMRELEEALTFSRVTPLIALDELTPRVRDVAIDIR